MNSLPKKTSLFHLLLKTQNMKKAAAKRKKEVTKRNMEFKKKITVKRKKQIMRERKMKVKKIIMMRNRTKEKVVTKAVKQKMNKKTKSVS